MGRLTLPINGDERMGHMPVYEYACTTCGERTEARQTFDDPPLEKCPICGGPLRKLYSPVGIVFKGSGFYSTESRKAAQSRDGHSESAPDKKGKADKQDVAAGTSAPAARAADSGSSDSAGSSGAESSRSGSSGSNSSDSSGSGSSGSSRSGSNVSRSDSSGAGSSG